MMRSATDALRALLPDLTAGRMPSEEVIAEAAATIAEIDKARADMREAMKPPTDAELTATLLSPGCHLPLTEPQWRELTAMAREPQTTFGKARAAVQNRLAKTMLAVLSENGTRCSITEAGRKILAQNTGPDGAYRPDRPGAPR